MGIRIGRFVPRTRRARLCCGGAGVFLLSGVLCFPLIVSTIVRAKLRSAVTDQLNAELTIGRFDYDFPYRVRVHDAKLVARDPAGRPVSLLDLRRLDVTLARSPLRAGPLVIKELVIDEPSVRLIRTADGIVGEKSLVKRAGGPEPPTRKLSEIFELSRVAVTGGKVVYEDRTRPGAVPLVWRGLQLDLGTRPQAPAVYAYEVKAGAPPMAMLDARGDVNIDDLVVRVAGATLEASLRPDAPESALPGELQTALRAYAIDGRLRLSATGTAALRAIDQSTFAGTLELSDARGRLPARGLDVRALSARIAYAKPDAATPLRLDVKNVEAETPQGVLRVTGGDISLTEDTWDVKDAAGSVTFADTPLPPTTSPSRHVTATLNDFDPRGTLRFTAQAGGRFGAPLQRPRYDVSIDADGVSFRLPEVPGRIDGLAGGVQVTDGGFTLGPLRARYGPRAAIRVSGGNGRFDGGLQLDGVAGWLVFRDAATPAGSDDRLDLLMPRGDVDFALAANPDLALTLTPRGLSIAVPGFGQRFEKLRGTIRIDKNAARVEGFTASFGGDAIAIDAASVPLSDVGARVRVEDIAGSINFTPPPPAYPAEVARVLAALGPIGTYNVSGAVDLDRSMPDAKPVYGLRITTELGAFKPQAVKTPVLFPRITAVVTQDAVSVSNIEVPVFGGKVVGRLRVRMGERTRYEGEFELKDIELAEAKMLWLDEGEGNQDLRGKASGRVKVWGEIPPGDEPAIDKLRALGMLRVTDGYFYEVPVLREISDWLGIAGGSVVGEAVATFAVQDRTISLKRGVVSSPVLAMQAKGEIGFDGRLKLVVTAAAPRDQPNTSRGRSGVDRFVGGIIGAVNQGLATAGQWGLYEFRVTGDNDNPRLRVVTPAINQTIDAVVGGIRDAARDTSSR